VLLVGFDGCEVRLCGLCAFVRPRVPCVSCVSRLPPVSFYRFTFTFALNCNFGLPVKSRPGHAWAPAKLQAKIAR